MGCSKPPKISGKVNSGSGDASVGSGELPPTSLAHFTTYVYEPIVLKNCMNSSCHHREEHHIDAQTSHDYFLQNARADFTDIKLSVAVERVDKGHNCWSDDCGADGEELLEGFQAWLDNLVEDGYKIPEQEFGAKAKEQVEFAGAAVHSLNLDPTQYMGGPISMATTTLGFGTAMPIEGGDGALEEYVGAPAGQDLQQGDANAGTAAFTVDIPAAGDYYVWARVMFPGDDQNSFFVTDGTNNFQFEGDPSADTWAWRQLMNNDPDDLQPQAVTFAAGPQTITFAQAEGGARLSYVLVTPLLDPNTEILSEKLYDVEVDISDVAGTDATMIATIWEKAQGEDQTKTIGVKELRVVSDKPLKIKGIYPLINGRFELNHATYTAVDGTFGSPEGQVVDTGGALGTSWLSEFGKDTLGFAFDSISAE